jgi:uncharacterized protein with PQ loop repeat
MPVINPTELLGWGSSAVLLVTLIRQVYTQWRTGATAGLSKWLFIGQCTASVGYTVYSFLLHNWVYLSSNVAILLTAVVGESLFLRNRRLAARGRRELGHRQTAFDR